MTAKSFIEYRKIVPIRAGDIARHPVHQRTSPLARFERKCGEFDMSKCIDLVHIVENPNPGPKYLAIDGATRVEACTKSKAYGPNTKLTCQLYGNGVAPTGRELDEMFLNLNADLVTVNQEVKFDRAVGAKRREAVIAEKLRQKLGPKFKARTGLWNIVQRDGEKLAERAVDFALDVWGTKYAIPMQVISGLALALSDKQDAARLAARTSSLRKRDPVNISLSAKTKMYGTVGIRESLSVWTVRVLLSQMSWRKK